MLPTKQSFIDEINNAAITSCQDSGLFPSVLIAQACLESNYGLSGLSLNCNNFFGIKAGSHWNGPVRSYPTKEFIKNQTIVTKVNFCHFKDFEDCLQYHNAMLKRVPTYAAAGLFKCKTPEKQCDILKVAGYATDPTYPAQLISIINHYGLKKYDVDENGDIVPFTKN